MLVLSFLVAFLLPLAWCDPGTAIYRNVRVQTLSPTLFRVENMGPNGFEDRTTFVVSNRAFEGIPILSTNKTGDTLRVQTQYYTVVVTQMNQPTDACFSQGRDVDDPVRSPFYPNGLSASDQGKCCSLCQTDPDCNGWVFDPTGSPGSINCWPLNAWSASHRVSTRAFGCLGNACVSVITSITVTSPDGKLLWQQQGTGEYLNQLQWPSPLAAKAYGVIDFPRFHVPSWGPSPHLGIPYPLGNTNGYDFSNNQNGDFYVFLLGNTLDSWFESRREFVQLVGPTPLLPDFAFGTWFTYWHSYTEAEAKNDIAMWKKGHLPLSVYGLDMNWRNTSNLQDHFYSHPDTALFPNFTEWFSFLHANGLKTYFNDHPFPVDWQTSPSEVGFRYGGLSEWMDRGLDYWWFDHNWGFSIPPPNVLPINGWTNSNTNGNWLGLDNVAWGSHVYFESVTQYYENKGGNQMRPITLTKFARPDWRPDMPSAMHQENPAHHRYPVWWTGDGVDLKASIQSMVDCGVHDFKPYVHSDCGGDYRGSAGDLLRWTAHCVFGTILRFHGADHRPWTYDAHTEAVIKSYLDMRYKLLPTFIASGQGSLSSGYPIVVRGDLIWPEYGSNASSNVQYIHLNDTLVAPIWDSTTNVTSISVWIPPGTWQDAWTGSLITGPKTTTVSKPYEQIPMWHRRGGFLITIDGSSTVPIEEQDWSVMTVEAFPDLLNSFDNARNVTEHRRTLFSLGSAARTSLLMTSVSDTPSSLISSSSSAVPSGGIVSFSISASEDGAERGWILRLHLLPGQHCTGAVADGEVTTAAHLAPVSRGEVYFPFGGAGTRPASFAGHVVEARIAPNSGPREILFKISTD